MMAVTFMLGVTVQGAQAGLNALAAMYYPTAIRSTGVSGPRRSAWRAKHLGASPFSARGRWDMGSRMRR